MKAILCIFTFLFLSFDISEDIINALKYNKHQELYRFLDEKLIVRILEKEDLLSKEQCIANLSIFFEKNPIKTFILLQNTTLSAHTQFIYGIVDTGSNKYKISILIKKSLIIQLRIDYFE